MKRSASSASAAAGRKEKRSGKKANEKTTGADLEERFDRGDRVLDHFETARMKVSRGGRRPAGRKKIGNVRMQILVSKKVPKLIEKRAKREGKTLSAVIEEQFVP
jgi:hypothetical protein